jgi:hypothetical protein
MPKSNLHVGHISLDPLMDEKLVVDILPTPGELPDGTIVGNYSVRGPNGFRIISRRHSRVLQGTSIQDTETAFTRCYLKSMPKRFVRKAESEAKGKSRPPQYCRPSESNKESFYVDIRSAYPTIYSRFSWRIDYLRGKYFSNDDDKLVYPFPMEWKSGRSYVVTGALPGSLVVVYDHKLVIRYPRNPYENPPLVSAVWDVLSAVARYAVDRFGARYFNLDGAVVGESQLYPYCNFLDSLHLPYRIKHHGYARILNVGSWRIGEHQTKRFDQCGLAIATDAIPVTMPEAKWILARFARL